MWWMLGLTAVSAAYIGLLYGFAMLRRHS